ncbi:MAG: GldG family protein [Defluviitaleaceae bacterium]|nr:GldG family protein [Defluviitaleaceae bacterium]
MKKLINAFKDKRLRYGSMSTVMILLAVGLFVTVNLVAGQLNVKKDLTGDQLFSLSSYSKTFLTTLKDDVTLYALFPTGQEDVMVQQLLEEYAASSAHIRLEYRDPLLNPLFVEGYAQGGRVEIGSIIVESAKRFKIIQTSEMFTREIDYNIWDYVITSIDIEPQISNAIRYVLTDNIPVMYVVTGNAEMPLSANLISKLEMANFSVREINLVQEAVPDDCDLLFITTPGRDWTESEAIGVRTYLENNGRAIFALGRMDSSRRFDMFDSLLAGFGVRMGSYIIVEGDTRYHYPGYPVILFPIISPHPITNNFVTSFETMFTPEGTGIETLDLRRPGTEITSLVSTSRRAYGKVNIMATTTEKEPGDVDGPFDLAVAIEETFFVDDIYTTKMVVLGCAYWLEDEFSDSINWDFIINSANWLVERSEGIYIPSRTPPVIVPLTLNQSQANQLMVISCIVLPVAAMAAGFVVWMLRRNN